MRPLRSFLTAKLGKAVDVSHFASLAEQLAQCSHLPVDGRVAVAALAERPDQIIQRLLAEGAEPLVQEDFVDLAQKGLHVLLVPALVPQDRSVGGEQLGYCEGFDFLDQSTGAERITYAACTCTCIGSISKILTLRSAHPVLHFSHPPPEGYGLRRFGRSVFLTGMVSRLPVTPPGAPFLSLLLLIRHGPPSKRRAGLAIFRLPA